MKKDLSIQLWSVRDCMKDEQMTAETFRALASYGFTGVQTAGGFVGGVDSFAASAKAAGLKVVGTHLELSDLANIDNAVKIHQTLGTDHAGIGNMPGLWSGGFTKENIYKFIDDANKVVPELAKHGLHFTYHHHAVEFGKIGNDVVLDLFEREICPSNSSIVLDTYWVQRGGASILEYLEKFAGRIDILHLKDAGVPFGKNDSGITELGAGNINFKDIVRVAEETGVKEFCYEQDGNHRVDPLASAKESAEYFFSLFD